MSSKLTEAQERKLTLAKELHQLEHGGLPNVIVFNRKTDVIEFGKSKYCGHLVEYKLNPKSN